MAGPVNVILLIADAAVCCKKYVFIQMRGNDANECEVVGESWPNGTWWLQERVRVGEGWASDKAMLGL